MAVPVPHTWTAGDDATSAALQTLTDAILFLLGSTTSGGTRRALAVMTQTVIQTAIVSGAALTLDAESNDYDNGHSTVTNTSRYTAQTAGWYDVEASASLAGNTTGSFRSLQIRVTLAGGGSTIYCEDNDIFPSGVVPNVILDLGIGTKVFLNVGDFVELLISHNATSLNTAVNSGNSRLAVEWRSN